MSELIKLFKKDKVSTEGLVVDIYDSLSNKELAFEHVDSFQENKEKFDLVLASAVLEHLPNFISVKERLISKVNLNGYFYCRTPWEFEVSKILKFYKVKWPRHLYDIGGDYWSIYFRKKNNFRIVLNETSNTEISKKNILNYIIAQLLKLISRTKSNFSLFS